MAKRIKSKPQRDDLDTYEDEPQPARRVAARRQPSRLRWFGTRLLAMLVLLLILVGFAPTLLVSTGLWKSAVNYAAPQLKGKLEVGSLSLGWLSPIGLKDIRLKDEAGQVLVEIGSIQGNRSILSLATDSANLGKFTIENAHAMVQLRKDGSNLEDFAAKLMPATPQPTKPASNSKMAVEVVITGSSFDIIDAVSGRSWKLDNVAGSRMTKFHREFRTL